MRDAGHTSEVIGLYAIKFDPVFRDRDVASYTAGDIPGWTGHGLSHRHS